MKQAHYMERALALAQNGSGYTSPNPMVGAVLVKNGQIIGEGHHPKPGQKHAEVMAIENAPVSAEGAEMFCNLEPCSHDTPKKRTPPCANRLITEKIKKVHISTIDPNPHVNGRGISALRNAGIEVEVGQLSEKATLLNEAYFKYIQTGVPLVHLKMAVSIDGRIATGANDSKWITDRDARKVVHQMRHEHDAVLVGLNTVRADNPRLTVRLVAGKQPLRVVPDTHLEIPENCSLVSDAFVESTYIFTTEHHCPEKRQRLEGRGVRIRIVDKDNNGQAKLKSILTELGRMGISSLLVEGGGRIYTEFIRQQQFDKISIFLAPIIIGKGISAIGDLGITKITDAIHLQKTTYEMINKQVLIRGYRNLSETLGKVSCLQESLKMSVE